MITLFGINNCDTTKKTKKWLDDQRAEFQFHDYKKLGCPSKLAEIFLVQFDLKSGTTWRKLPEEQKNGLDRGNAVVLMEERPSIIKRPILDIDGQWVIGFDTEKLSAII